MRSTTSSSPHPEGRQGRWNNHRWTKVGEEAETAAKVELLRSGGQEEGGGGSEKGWGKKEVYFIRVTDLDLGGGGSEGSEESHGGHSDDSEAG